MLENNVAVAQQWQQLRSFLGNNNKGGGGYLSVQQFRQDKNARTNLVERSTLFAAAEKNWNVAGKEASVSLTEPNHRAVWCFS